MMTGRQGKDRKVPREIVEYPECPALTTRGTAPCNMADGMAIGSVFDALYGPPVLSYRHRSAVRMVR